MSRQRVSSTSSRCFPDHVRPNRRYPDGRTDYGVRHLIDHPSALVVPVLYVPNRMRQPVQFLSRKNSLIARSAIKLPWFNSNRRENDRPSRRRRKCIIESERYQSHPLSRERERERERTRALYAILGGQDEICSNLLDRNWLVPDLSGFDVLAVSSRCTSRSWYPDGVQSEFGIKWLPKW